MFLLKKSAILLVFASAMVWARAQAAPDSPLKTSAPTTDSASGAQASLPDSTKLEILKAQKADYPLGASQEGIQGQVVVQVHVNEKGEVESVDVLSGEKILAEAAVNAAKKWRFKPFIRDGKPIKVVTKLPFDFYFGEKVMTNGVSADGRVVSTGLPNGAGTAREPVQINQGVSEGLLIRQIAPIYPAKAKQFGIQGHVLFKAIIGKDGSIQNLKIISGPKQLVAAAIGAVQQWRYRPYTLNGEAVEVETTIDVNFQLR